MHTQPAPESRRRTNLALLLLFLGTFTMGSAELVVVGVLQPVAADLGVPVSTAGFLVTAYALGLSIGGPILTALTVRLGRRPLLWSTLAAWLVLNLVAVLTADFATFVVVRAVTGALQGLFVGLAFTAGISMVPTERIGRALSAVIGGFAVSTALGVPIGTLIGEASSWEGAFLAIVGLGVLVLAALVLVIPPVPSGGAGNVWTQARHAFAPRVLAVLGLCVLLFAGPYATLTYITPLLDQVTSISGARISAFLLAYGAATAAGAFAGGRFAGRDASRAILVTNVVLAAALVLLYFAARVPLLVALALVVWGIAGFGMVPSLQYRIVSLSGPGADLAATLPASAINAGIAIGSLMGGWALATHGASAPVIVGIVVSVIAVPASWATGFLRPPATDPAPVSGDPLDRSSSAA
ncbi:MFS transporter [Dactylosporangium aurantiacum]|uniref:MFS transporter n=1 Tax=Dactylosporangium aurantiacum TaxID=35754 RepID=A0A9Q9INE2_9ACTN|nr:MFS transporter [Dactylosporangium aurantiacum]MDG6105546.1 MFS transporter [Dactylosporangium aurantiacum]UWZ57110.1 MFS transporter [Dactylosporangium aurantiacum]